MCQSSDLQPLTPDSELVAGGGGVENMCSPYLDSIERNRKCSFAFMFTTKARNMQDSVYISRISGVTAQQLQPGTLCWKVRWLRVRSEKGHR